MDGKFLNHLKKDPVMAGLIEVHGPLPIREGEVDLFTDLVETIVQQQLSEKAGGTIWGRVKELFAPLPYKAQERQVSEKVVLVPKAVLEVGDGDLREKGISYSKIRYIKGVAEAVLQSEIDLESLWNLDDEGVVRELVKLKGVGRWTAEMMLMFSLRRPDVFSVGDLGLRTAVSKLYGVDRDDWEAIEKVSLRWKPYRTMASRYLWKSLDNQNGH